MGVGISLSKLAGHVAKAGGIGIISAAQIGFREPDFMQSPLEANIRALKKELQKAREIAPLGIIGVNIMVALSHYKEMVEAAINAGADLIISGAGLPMNLPLYAKGSSTLLVPIVSSPKAAKIILSRWLQKYNKVPDAFVIEGPLAGGHLGFKTEELNNPPSVIKIFKEVQTTIKPFEERLNKKIPLLVAGGIYEGEDVAFALRQGADGVQMATRFVTTYECDAPDAYKSAYLSCEKEDIKIISSPVGMPGRAIVNDYIKNPPGNTACLYHCLEKCSITSIPYCISKALIAAAEGDMAQALLFCGSNAYRAKKLEHVDAIMRKIQAAL